MLPAQYRQHGTGMLYLIGGVTRAGKTTLRQTLQRERAMAGATTDTVRDNVARTRPHWGIGAKTPPREIMAQLEPHIEAFLRELLAKGADFAFEGDALSPATAAKFAATGAARAVFLIYPECSAAEKLAQLRSANEGWIAGVPDAQLKRTIEEAIADSKVLCAQCLAQGVAFVDTSRLDLPEVTRAGLAVLCGES